MEAAAVASGFFTGIIVGLTGVGGGSLMTPILIFLLGIAPPMAMGMALVVTNCAMMLKRQLHELGRTWRSATPDTFKRLQPGFTVLAGAAPWSR